VIDADGSPVGLYRKMHIPDDPAYYEKFYFTPETRGFGCSTRVWDGSARWSAGTSGILRPRASPRFRAHILLHPTAIGWHPKEKATHGAEQLDARARSSAVTR
jgi:N-carbamoylputrescine amidase